MTADAVVVGAGPNGLVAANILADRGWSVTVLEQQAEPGGAVRSDRELDPRFVHDTFSAFYPLGIGSPHLTRLRLEEHGLRWVHAPAVLGHPLQDGRWALMHRRAEDTAAGLEAITPGDGEAWWELCRWWDRVGDQLTRAFLAPFPPVRHGGGAALRIARSGGLDAVRTLASPALALARDRFAGEPAALLLAGCAGHADIPLTSPGSGVFALLMALLGQSVGFPVPEGGAGSLTDALVRRLRAHGGEVLCGREVARVEVEGGRAVAVRTADGERVVARRAVVADVTAPQLFGRLLAPEDVPGRVARGMRAFEMDPGTVKVDWALDGPVPWREAPVAAPGTVHVADSVEQMSASLAQVTSGYIPSSPFLLAGQMTTSDPTRSPSGTESLWAYAHVPQPEALRGDAGDGTVRGTWDRDDSERFADRMQARLEHLAPGLGSRILARRVLGPRELEARDANLRGGAVGGGTYQLQQDLVFRPVPAMWGRPSTGVGGLFLASASAHPGGGVHGAPGAHAARAALGQWRRRRPGLRLRR